MKLHHVLAIESGLKTKVKDKLTAIYHTFQKPALFNGHMKTWTARDANPESTLHEVLPDERQNVQQSTVKLLVQIQKEHAELFDMSFQRDVTNCAAKADIVVDGKIILKDAPITYLLWLGHQFDDLYTNVKNMPTLDPAEKWTLDKEQSLYATGETMTIRTKKLQTPLLMHPASKEHPAQVQLITDDKATGTWKTIKYSGAMPQDKKDALLVRIEKLQHAIQQAKETANSHEVPKDLVAGKPLLDFVFASDPQTV